MSSDSKTFHIAVLPGDGIGIDVTREALRVLEALTTSLDGVNFAFHEYSVGAAEFLKNGNPLPEDALNGCGDADAVLLGAMGLPDVRWPDGKEMTPQIDLRERFELYCGLRPIRQVAHQFPDVKTDHVYVDAAALFLVQRPETFDVLVTENMFGDILSDLAAGLVGGMGMAPSADIGNDCAVFQPSHGTAPDIAGEGIANPVAMILSAALMLEWLDHPETKRGADRIHHAVQTVLEDPANRTPDCKGSLTTTQMTDKIIHLL